MTVLEQSDDAASVLASDGWQIPTTADIDELFQYCSWSVENRNNVIGVKFIGPNGNSIFFPYPKEYWPEKDGYLYGVETFYWSKSLATCSYWEHSYFSDQFACGIQIHSTYKGIEADKDFNYRAMPGIIRPFRK